MHVNRRALLLGTTGLLVGCAGDPTVVAPSDASSRVLEAEPVQDPALARAASLLDGVQVAVTALPDDEWRAAALAQLDEQIARCASLYPFGTPAVHFQVSPTDPVDLPTAITDAVDGIAAAAADVEADDLRLFLCSIAAATAGLARQDRLPGAGASPATVGSLPDQRQPALEHVWALINGLEHAIGALDGDDQLRSQLRDRLAEVKQLRGELREAAGVPSQPAAFVLPTAMRQPDEIRSGWAQLEVRVLEALVLLAAQTGDDDHWRLQVIKAQDAGGRIPRWPGWD